MRRRLALLLCMLVFASASLALAEDWNKSFNLTGRADLRVTTDDAAVRVTTWDKNEIAAHVIAEGYKIGPDGLRITEHQTGNTVELTVKYPHEHFGISIHRHNVQVEIQMPREGSTNIRTGDGSVRLSGLKGDIDIYTGDGSIEVDSVDGNLRAHTGDGHIRADGRFDELKLRTGDGRVEASAKANSSIKESWYLQTGDGSVTLRLPDSFAADVDLHTNDGHINLDLPLTASGRFGSNAISGKLNGGGRSLSVHTGDGSIHLGRS